MACSATVACCALLPEGHVPLPNSFISWLAQVQGTVVVMLQVRQTTENRCKGVFACAAAADVAG